MDLWEAVEENYDVLKLPSNPMVAQMKNHKERKTRKAKNCLFCYVKNKFLPELWTSSLPKRFGIISNNQGYERTKGMQVLNLGKEFEMQSMKETETIKGYVDQLLSIANKVWLLGKDFTNALLENID